MEYNPDYHEKFRIVWENAHLKVLAEPSKALSVLNQTTVTNSACFWSCLCTEQPNKVWDPLDEISLRNTALCLVFLRSHRMGSHWEIQLSAWSSWDPPDGISLRNTTLCLVFLRSHRMGSHWEIQLLSLIHIWRCRRVTVCRSRWSPYH